MEAASGKTESGEARSASARGCSRPTLAVPRRGSLGGIPSRYSLFTLTTGQPGEPGMLASGDRVEVSAMLSPGAGKFMGEGASAGWIPSGEPADPRDTGESEK